MVGEKSDARLGRADGTRRAALTQTPDLMPTILDFFDAPPLKTASGSLLPTIRDESAKIHDAIIYGYFGGAVNLADGQHTYFRYPEHMSEADLNEYTLMPAHMLAPFSRAELGDAIFYENLTFSNGYPVLQVPVRTDSDWYNSHGPGAMRDCRTAVYDLHEDPSQLTPIDNPKLETELAKLMTNLMAKNNAPSEAYTRLGLSGV